MNNKGFIATSLIYSFFLIFITLFLTIIADYLQNKVLLNTIENGIKDNINNTKSIEDFDVGDIVNFYDTDENLNSYSDWIVSKVDYEGKIILYSLGVEDDQKSFPEDSPCTKLSYISSDLTIDNIKTDIELGYQNETYINRLIYDFDINTTNKNYKLADGKYASIHCNDCTKTDGTKCNRGEENCSCTITDENIVADMGIFSNDFNCIITSGNDKTRNRLEVTIGNNIFEKANINSVNTTYLKCS